MIDVVPMYEPRYYERSAQRHMARYLQNCLFINAPWDLSGNPASRPEIDAEAGNCSLSLAPMRTEDGTRHADVFSYIEDIPPAMFSEGIPWTWTTYRGYQDVLRDLSLSLNIGSFVGHTALRQYVMGADAWERPATDDERRCIADLLAVCLGDGLSACPRHSSTKTPPSSRYRAG